MTDGSASQQDTTRNDGLPRSGRPRLGRRGFLARAGAAGLTAAATMFGGAPPAQAQTYPVLCCNLQYGQHADCWSGADYIWSCSYTVSLWCRCCEDHDNRRSAVSCRYN